MARSIPSSVFIRMLLAGALAAPCQAAIIGPIPPTNLNAGYNGALRSSITKQYCGGGAFGWCASPTATDNSISENKPGSGLAIFFAAAMGPATSDHIISRPSTLDIRQVAATVPVGNTHEAASNHTSAGVPIQAQHRRINGEFPRK